MSAPGGLRLRSTTVALDGSGWDDHPARRAGDIVFERDGYGLAAMGCALRIDRAVVEHVLASIDVDDQVGLSGCGPIAVGALPFVPGAPATLVVPALVVGRSRDGTVWETRVHGVDIAGIEPQELEPDGFVLRSAVPHEEFRAMVAEAVRRVRAGVVDKVVLARDVVVDADRDIVVPAVIERLRALYPSCTTFCVDGFVGASPELLVSRTGGSVVSHPLAGTRPRSGDPEVDAVIASRLLASDKDRREHAAVVDMIGAVLRRRCTALDVPTAPSIVPLRNVVHLGTRLSGELAQPWPSVLDLVEVLHPTPAVAGSPTAAALQVIADIEGRDRGRYAGPVGWVDRRGDGEWVVGIRSADVDGPRARMVAGVGIVAGSNPDEELLETQLKLQALLAAIVRP